jgi:hypothetical protein
MLARSQERFHSAAVDEPCRSEGESGLFATESYVSGGKLNNGSSPGLHEGFTGSL